MLCTQLLLSWAAFPAFAQDGQSPSDAEYAITSEGIEAAVEAEVPPFFLAQLRYRAARNATSTDARSLLDEALGDLQKVDSRSDDTQAFTTLLEIERAFMDSSSDLESIETSLNKLLSQLNAGAQIKSVSKTDYYVLRGAIERGRADWPAAVSSYEAALQAGVLLEPSLCLRAFDGLLRAQYELGDRQVWFATMDRWMDAGAQIFRDSPSFSAANNVLQVAFHVLDIGDMKKLDEYLRQPALQPLASFQDAKTATDDTANEVRAAYNELLGVAAFHRGDDVATNRLIRNTLGYEVELSEKRSERAAMILAVQDVEAGEVALGLHRFRYSLAATNGIWTADRRSNVMLLVRALEDRGKETDAVEFLEWIGKHMRGGELAERGDLLELRARLQLRIGNYQDARTAIKQAVGVIRRENTELRERRTRRLAMLAKIEFEAGNLADASIAIKRWNASLGPIDEAHLPERALQFAIQLAVADRAADELLRNARSSGQVSVGGESVALGDVILSVANNLLLARQWDAADGLLRQFDMAPAHCDSAYTANAWHILGRIAQRRGQPDRAAELFGRAAICMRAHGTMARYWNFKHSHARALLEAGHEDQSVRIVLEALQDPQLEPMGKASFGSLLDELRNPEVVGAAAKRAAAQADELRCARARRSLAAAGIPDPSQLESEAATVGFLVELRARLKDYGENLGQAFEILQDNVAASERCGRLNGQAVVAALLLELDLLWDDGWAPDIVNIAFHTFGIVGEGYPLSEVQYTQVADQLIDAFDDTLDPVEAKDLINRLRVESRKYSAKAKMLGLRAALKGVAHSDLSAGDAGPLAQATDALLDEAATYQDAESRDMASGLAELARRHRATALAPQALRAATMAIDFTVARQKGTYSSSTLKRYVESLVTAIQNVEPARRPPAARMDQLADDIFGLEWRHRGTNADSKKQARIDSRFLRQLDRINGELLRTGYTSAVERIVAALDRVGLGQHPQLAATRVKLMLRAGRGVEAASFVRSAYAAKDASYEDTLIDVAYVDGARAAYTRGDFDVAAQMLTDLSAMAAVRYGEASFQRAIPLVQNAILNVCAKRPSSQRAADDAFAAVVKMPSEPARWTTSWQLSRALMRSQEYERAEAILSDLHNSIQGAIAAGMPLADSGLMELTAWRGALALQRGDREGAVGYWWQLATEYPQYWISETRVYALAVMLTTLDANSQSQLRGKVASELTKALLASEGPNVTPRFVLARHLLQAGDLPGAWRTLQPGVDSLRMSDYRPGINANALADAQVLYAAASALQLPSASAQLLSKQMVEPEFILAMMHETVSRRLVLTEAMQDAAVWAIQILENSATARDVTRAFARLSVKNEALSSVVRRLATTDEALIGMRSGVSPFMASSTRMAVWMWSGGLALNNSVLHVPCEDPHFFAGTPLLESEPWADMEQGEDEDEKWAAELLKAEQMKQAAEQERLRRERELDLLALLDEDTEVLQIEVPQLLGAVFRKPVSLASLRSALRNNEWLVAAWPTSSAVYSLAFSNRADSFRFQRSSQNDERIRQSVASLRLSLQLDASGHARPFDAAASHQLYRDLYENVLSGVAPDDHVIWIAGGALGSLPPHVLLSKAAPRDQVDSPEMLRQLAWLADRARLSVLPGIANFVGGAGKGGALANAKVLLFADPAFEGSPPACFEGVEGSPPHMAVKSLCRLTETADLTVSLARTFANQQFCRNDGTDWIACLAGVAASEQSLREMSTTGTARRFDMVVFATHGFTAKETQRMSGVSEPAIALSATGPSGETDGIVTSSEIASLDLAASLVMITACNSGDSDGTNDGAALSGLARAFFQAGAESVLASHWAVDQQATVFLANRFSELVRNRSVSQALSGAMQEMRSGARRELPNAFAHPVYWAPFVVVSRN